MESFSFINDQEKDVFYYKWEPEGINPRGVVQIAHGMAEKAIRYDKFARELSEKGYVVYANDHRGHGQTAGSVQALGQIGKGGFIGMIRDMKALNDIIKEENGELPIYLFGHSMGSFLTQGYIALHGGTLRGAILSGTKGREPLVTYFGAMIAWREMKKRGFDTPSPFLSKLSFGGYNKNFKPNRTEYDWLSRDNSVVDTYIHDPYCGGVFPSGFYYELLKGLNVIQSRLAMEKIPKKLPIYIFSGDKDPVGRNSRTVLGLIRDYKKLGIEDVEYKFYKDGRHEMLNEINRDEVVKDIINWMERH
jgi:alpha-beta hydrolase superfamily lysophospholipase